jgi:archaellum component FlaC
MQEERLTRLEEDINRILERLEDLASLESTGSIGKEKDAEIEALLDRIRSLSKRVEALSEKIKILLEAKRTNPQ